LLIQPHYFIELSGFLRSKGRSGVIALFVFSHYAPWCPNQESDRNEISIFPWENVILLVILYTRGTFLHITLIWATGREFLLNTSNRINCCMTKVPRQDRRFKKSTKQLYKYMYFISAEGGEGV
jgi:hypothetical protein